MADLCGLSGPKVVASALEDWATRRDLAQPLAFEFGSEIEFEGPDGTAV